MRETEGLSKGLSKITKEMIREGCSLFLLFVD